MEKIKNLSLEEEKLLNNVKEAITQIKNISSLGVSDLTDGVNRLKDIRISAYEDINQIQHAHLLLEATKWLSSKYNGLDWYWHPYQTGGKEEPDLKGVKNNEIIVSVEATTSENPKGGIDSRMRDTLRNLSSYEGERYYFVRTSTMERRALTKIQKSGFDIKVIQLSC